MEGEVLRLEKNIKVLHGVESDDIKNGILDGIREEKGEGESRRGRG
jgi:hypothetical protein